MVLHEYSGRWQNVARDDDCLLRQSKQPHARKHMYWLQEETATGTTYTLRSQNPEVAMLAVLLVDATPVAGNVTLCHEAVREGPY